MKNLKSIAIALLVTVSTIATAQVKKVDAAKSSIAWLGKKVTCLLYTSDAADD